jgi:hypothetical protein
MRLRLKIFTNHQDSLEYTTLSHCRGGANIHKLQKDNQAFLCADISLNRLPKTFKDILSIETLTLFARRAYSWIRRSNNIRRGLRGSPIRLSMPDPPGKIVLMKPDSIGEDRCSRRGCWHLDFSTFPIYKSTLNVVNFPVRNQT